MTNLNEEEKAPKVDQVIAKEPVAAPVATPKTNASSQNKGGYNRGFRNQSRSADGGSDLVEKVIQINRVAKVVKGGKRFHFSALVIVGNTQGEVGFALGKANEVSDAIRKGLVQARKSFIKIPMDGTTIPHDVIGQYGAAKVILRRGVPGTGIIAGGAVRALCECSGIKDILAKSLGSDNAINVLKAGLDGFSKLIVKRTLVASESK